MCEIKMYKKDLIFWLMISISFFLYPAYDSYGFSWENIDLENSEPVELNALIMEINTTESYIIVAEKKVKITSFKHGKKFFKTKLLNEEEMVVPLSSFKKGQRILVKGVKLIDGQIAVLEIKKITSDKKRYHIMQKALPIEPLTLK